MFRPIVSFYRVISIRVLVCIHDRPDWFSTTSAFERIRRTRTRSRRAGRTFSFVTTVSLRDLIEGLTRSSFANRNGQIEATYEAEYRFSCAIYYSVIIDIVVNKLFFILAIGYFIESRVPTRPSIRVFQIVYRCFSRSASLFRRSFFFRIVSQIILDRSNGEPIAERIPIADFSQAPPSLSGLHTGTNVFIPSSRGKRYRGVHPFEDCSMARKFVRLCAKERRMEGTANEIDVQKSWSLNP